MINVETIQPSAQELAHAFSRGGLDRGEIKSLAAFSIVALGADGDDRRLALKRGEYGRAFLVSDETPLLVPNDRPPTPEATAETLGYFWSRFGMADEGVLAVHGLLRAQGPDSLFAHGVLAGIDSTGPRKMRVLYPFAVVVDPERIELPYGLEWIDQRVAPDYIRGDLAQLAPEVEGHLEILDRLAATDLSGNTAR